MVHGSDTGQELPVTEQGGDAATKVDTFFFKGHSELSSCTSTANGPSPLKSPFS